MAGGVALDHQHVKEAAQYKPFITPEESLNDDWCYRIASPSCLDQLAEARRLHCALPRPLRVLVLYGSNRTR